MKPHRTSWLAFLTSFFIAAVSSLRSLAVGSLEQRLVIGGLSAVVGQMVDAFANPAWQFGHIMLPFWIIVGLTISITRGKNAVSAPMKVANNVVTSVANIASTTQLVMALLAAGALLWLILRTAFALPAPYL